MASRYNVAATLQVNNKAFIAGFAAAERSVKSFNTALHTASASAAAYQRSMAASNAAMAASLGAVGKQSTAMKNQAEGAGRSMRTLQTAAMGAAAGATVAGTGAGNAGRKMGVFGKGADLAARDLDRFNRTARGFSMVGMAAAAVAIGGATAAIRTFISYESAFANFEKVTEANTQEFENFDQAFRQMSRNLPAGYEEITNVAAAASQLGIEKASVEQFTETMIRLGTSTTMSAEDAAMTLSRLMNIMGTHQSDVDRLGSTLVELGNNYAATEDEIAGMSMRIAGMGRALGMTEADVLALSTSLTSLGVRVEMGGSAISTIMSKTSSEIQRGTEVGQQWADVMGMSIEEVQVLFEEDAYGAMIKMVEGLEKVDESGGNVDQTLRDLGITEIRQLDVMKRLIGSSEDLAEAQQVANREWRENSALMEESEARYDTLESRLTMMANGVKNAFANMGDAINQTSGGLLDTITEQIDRFEAWTETMFDAEGGLNEVGRSAIETGKNIAGIALAVGIAGAAFWMFGPAGAVTVAALGGLWLIKEAFQEVVWALGGDAYGNAMNTLESSTSIATENAGKSYMELRQSVDESLSGIALESGAAAQETREKVVSEFDQMQREIRVLLDEEKGMLISQLEQRMEGANEATRSALEQQKQNIINEYHDIEATLGDHVRNITDHMGQLVDENGKINMKALEGVASSAKYMDEVAGTAMANSTEDLLTYTAAFKDSVAAEEESYVVRKNLADTANALGASLMETTAAYNQQREAVEASNVSDETKAHQLNLLDAEYQNAVSGATDFIRALEQEAESYGVTSDWLDELWPKYRELLGYYEEGDRAASDYNTEMKSTEQAHIDNANAAAVANVAWQESINALNEQAKLVGDIPSLIEGVKAATGQEALDLGLTFSTELADGTRQVDLGEDAKVKLDEFISGIQDGTYKAEEVGLAMINKLRGALGQSSLNMEGYNKVGEFVAGITEGEPSVEEVSESLGIILKEGLEVDTGTSGVMSVQDFIEGVRSGEYGVVEVANVLSAQLEESLNTDLSEVGVTDIETFAAGMQAGLISVEEVVAFLGQSVEKGAEVDLGEQGSHTTTSLVTGLMDGSIEVETAMLAIRALIEGESHVDLEPQGSEIPQTLAAGIAQASGIPIEAVEQMLLEMGVDPAQFHEDGMEIPQEILNGIMETYQLPVDAAGNLSTDVENELGDTSDGGGGVKAPTDFSVGFANSMPWVISLAQKLSGDAESELGSTTDGDGGSKAGGAFASGISSQIGNAQASANSAKSTVEGALGSTTDSSGGNKAGGMFVSGIRSQIGNAQSAANTHKSNTERTLGSTTDSQGGNKAGTMFVSGIRSQIGNAQSAANTNKTNVESALGATTDNGGGKKAGSMFVQGVAGQAGASRSAGSNVSSSARGGLSSNSDTYGLGQNFGSGFVRGISSFVGAAVSAAANLARSALNAVRNAQRSSSPSKETMKLGGDFGDGFALAIVDKTKEAVNAARNMARDAINAAGDESARNALAVDVGGYGGANSVVRGQVSHEVSTVGADRMSVQPAHITTVIGGQEFETFSENINAQNTKRANFKDSYR